MIEGKDVKSYPQAENALFEIERYLSMLNTSPLDDNDAAEFGRNETVTMAVDRSSGLIMPQCHVVAFLPGGVLLDIADGHDDDPPGAYFVKRTFVPYTVLRFLQEPRKDMNA